MFRCIEYTAFLWKAKGRHGTHSPFAYWLVDVVARQQVIAAVHPPLDIPSKKTRQFIAKLQHALAEHQLSHFDQTAEKPSKPCIYILALDQLPHVETALQHQLWHPETIFVVLNPRAKNKRHHWQKLCQMEVFHFTADCYFFGLLSPRPGQVKEHFYLKLS
ncbi:MAG: hypothetical protein NWR10_00530 [Crocinitomicaceae bacterium]|nr:hypothetical protein [Crocinitomicaceae bacterium]